MSSAVLRSVDHLIVGGGPAGSMAALRLASAGRNVVLLEKESGPHHKVCGEFLSREAVAYLHQAGIVALGLGAATIGSLRLSAGSKVITASLPFQALSLSRRVLDEALLARAELAGCRILRGLAVESLTPEADGWIVSLSNGATVRAPTVFLATGKHDLRGFTRTPAKQSDLVGFKTVLAAGARSNGRSRAIAWTSISSTAATAASRSSKTMSPISASSCVRSTLREAGSWPQLLASILRGNRHLRRLLDGAAAVWPRPLAISPIPYGYFARETRGLWCVGDQAAVIPSFTGDGISIALHSAALAAQMFLAGHTADAYSRALRAQLARSMTLATGLSRVAVTGAGRAAALAALSLAPGIVRWVAASTRIPQSSLVLGECALNAARPAAHPAA